MHTPRRPPSDPREWHLQHDRRGYWIMDEFGEDIAWVGLDFDNAKALLDDMIADEIEAREQEGPALDPMRGVEFPFAGNH